jgi:hypothetical protein
MSSSTTISPAAVAILEGDWHSRHLWNPANPYLEYLLAKTSARPAVASGNLMIGVVLYIEPFGIDC